MKLIILAALAVNLMAEEAKTSEKPPVATIQPLDEPTQIKFGKLNTTLEMARRFESERIREAENATRIREAEEARYAKELDAARVKFHAGTCMISPDLSWVKYAPDGKWYPCLAAAPVVAEKKK
jgi:hypothetical protein